MVPAALQILLFCLLCTFPSGCDTQKNTRADLKKAIEVSKSLRVEKRPTEALSLLDKFLAESPELISSSKEDATAFYQERIDLLLLLEKTEQAILELDTLEKQLGALPPDAQLQKARALVKLGKGEEALPFFGGCTPDKLGLFFIDYAKALVSAKRLDDAVLVLAAGLMAKPWHEEAYLEIGRVLARRGKDQIAEVFLKRHQEDEPRRIAEQEALSYEKLGQFAKAFHTRGTAEGNRENLFQSMIFYNLALKIDKNMGAAYLALAEITMFLQRPEEAIKVLKRLPQNPKTLEKLAHAYWMQTDVQSASEKFQEAGSLSQGEEAERLLKLGNRVLKDVEGTEGLEGKQLEIQKAKLKARKILKSSTLSQGVSALRQLAEDYYQAGDEANARKLALFLLEYSKGAREGAPIVLKICNRKQDFFYRLKAAWVLSTDQDSSAFEAEVKPLGISAKNLATLFKASFPAYQAFKTSS